MLSIVILREFVVFPSLSEFQLGVKWVLSPNGVAPRVMVAVTPNCVNRNGINWPLTSQFHTFSHLFFNKTTNMLLITVVKLIKWVVERLQYTSFKWSSDVMLFKISLAQIAISSKLVPWGRPSLTRMGERSTVRLHNRCHDMETFSTLMAICEAIHWSPMYFPHKKNDNDFPFDVGPS